MPKTKITKEEILRECWSVFHLHGYNATSLAMVAKAVGLGKAGLIHHFGTKAGLMRAVLNYAREAYQGYVLDVIWEDLPLEQRLEKMLRRQLKLGRIEQRGCFFANMILETGQDGEFTPQLKHFYQDWLDALTALLTERFPPEEARERAYRYFIDYEGSIMLYKLDGSEDHLQKCIVRNLEMLSTPIKLQKI
ncbi:MAG: TetR/AcrR family transcriptional regulator [Bacteroidota bacterium]